VGELVAKADDSWRLVDANEQATVDPGRHRRIRL
jgi:hypothetical protein